MPERLNALLGWYLGAWTRMGRKAFGIALVLATLPGVVLMALGFGAAAGSYLEPLLGLVNMLNGGDYQGSLDFLNGLAQSGGEATAEGFDWTALINSLCLLAVAPLVRMRLRDMGWQGWQELALSVLFNLSVVEGVLEALTGRAVLPMGFVWGMANFVGYAWLSMAKGQPKTAVHQKVNADAQPQRVESAETPPAPRKEYLNHDPED